MRQAFAATALIAALWALAACGREAAAPGSAPAAAPPDDAASPSRPWAAASEPGLWRVAAGGPTTSLRCHAAGALLPDEGAGCSAPRHDRTADGFTRTRRCGGRTVRTAVVGDLASGFSARRADGPGAETLTTWLRMGPCPEGWRAGETRVEGLRPPTAAPTAAPRGSAAPPRLAPPPEVAGPLPSDPIAEALDRPPEILPELDPVQAPEEPPSGDPGPQPPPEKP